MGGDCLNSGCVPSKALIAAGEAAETVRRSGTFGVNGHEPDIDFARVHDHVHGVIAAIAPHDSIERFEGLGVQVIQGAARFAGPKEVEVEGRRIRARRFVIATGSSPALPPIPGLDVVSFLTNESVFDLKERPDHLIVIGGGPIGVELAQAQRRLGARVTLLEVASLMGKDDPEAAEVVRRRLIAEGIDLQEGIRIEALARKGNGIAVKVEAGGEAEEIVGSHLLIAAGRRPNVNGLGLRGGRDRLLLTRHRGRQRLRTSNRRSSPSAT